MRERHGRRFKSVHRTSYLSSHGTLAELIRSSGKLKKIKRSGWLHKAGITDCESVADHSFRTAILGAYFAEESDLDSGKVARMCLIHDLAESTLGDLMPEEKSSKTRHRNAEHTFLSSLFRKLPRKARKAFLSDLQELWGRNSEEARLVWQIDKFEMGLQQREYLSMGYDKVKLKQFEVSSRLKLPGFMKQILEEYEHSL